MVSLMVPPFASPAKYFLRLLGGQCMNLSWYSRGQRADKSIVLIHETVSPFVTQKPSHPSASSVGKVRLCFSGKS